MNNNHLSKNQCFAQIFDSFLPGMVCVLVGELILEFVPEFSCNEF